MNNIVKKKEILFLNFSELQFDKDIVKSIENDLKMPVMCLKKSVSINLNNNCYQQIVCLIDEIRKHIIEHEFVMICPPALSIAAIYIVNEIYATTGMLPYVIELEKVKQQNKSVLFNKGIYRLKRIRSLEKEKFFTRKKIQENNDGKN